MASIHKICILGGTGFIGRHLACELARREHRLRVLTRRRERHRELLVFPTLELVEAQVHDPAALAAQFQGFDAVINLPGILNPSGRDGSFAAVHAELPAKVARACTEAGVPRLLHMSALHADAGAPSEYLRSKHAGEEAVHAATAQGLAVTSFRPSVVFGPGDAFINRFAQLLALTPLVFPLACPQARFAPVYVGDVARAFADALADKASHGRRYDLCGPHQYTLRQLVEYIAACSGHHRLVMGLGGVLSRLQARALQLLPGSPFSMDNYRSLTVDSVCGERNGLHELGITPTALESVVPGYLGNRNRVAILGGLRSSARRAAG